MGHNTGSKDNVLNAVASAWVLLLSYWSFFGIRHLAGFLNEEEDAIGFFILDQVEFFFAYPLKRYLHLAIIPSFLGLFILTIERFPGKFWRNKTLSPVNLSLIAAVVMSIQLIPAILLETSPFGFIDLTNPTWFSDKIMEDYGGYAAFTIIFLMGILIGFIHAVFSWAQTGGENQSIIWNATMSFLIILLSYLSFVGLLNLEGFLAEAPWHTTSLDDFLVKYGFLTFLRGPIRRYTHLIAIPGLIGLGHLTWRRFANMSGPVNKMKKRRTRRKAATRKNTQLPNYTKLGLISLFFIFVQTGVAILIGIPHTWLSDLFMIPWGYSIFAGSYFLGQIFGLLKAIFGGLQSYD
ncbi:hypothetical protein LCGC14_0194660 [marine sediment metagenome]|uniref:Uncharacterized protein n=1 Tax=marine sediment metagenome TaxID=412755 RepID=A0A0F9UPR2_9ZZZZ